MSVELPQHGKGAQTRARLLRSAAAELVASEGNMEVAAVAERAGTSIGLTYRYFKNKGALAAAVVDDYFNRQDEAVFTAPIQAPTWRERERRRVELLVAFHYAEPLAPVMLGVMAREVEFAQVLFDRRARQAALAAANLTRGQDLGEVDPEIDTTLAGPMLLSGIREALRVALAAGDQLDAGYVTREILRFAGSVTGVSCEGVTAR